MGRGSGGGGEGPWGYVDKRASEHMNIQTTGCQNTTLTGGRALASL